MAGLLGGTPMDIRLNFVNDSNDNNNSEVVIFQKNVAAEASGTAVAWTVIRNCGNGDHHPFAYPMATQVAASDSWGNYTPLLDASNGDVFEMAHTRSGDELVRTRAHGDPQAITVRNALTQGAIAAYAYKDGRTIAEWTGIAPGQQVAFALEPEIWIGVASDVVEGQVMDAATVEAINTQISLLGIASADIVMTGGGSGPKSQPFMFTLSNVVMA
jgi:hypothetical protein